MENIIGSNSDYNSNWLFQYDLMEDIAVPGAEFAGATTGLSWPAQLLLNDASPNASVEVECSIAESGSLKEVGSKKRVEHVDCSSADSDHSIKEVGPRKRFRSESSGTSCSKACREKLRRDRLNERFLELVAVMEPGRLGKADKGAILSDAARMVTQLRSESRNLKDTIDDLQAKVKDLKAEKSDLREERQRLREDKEKLEQQVVRAMSFVHHHPPFINSSGGHLSTAAAATTTNKVMPFNISYPAGMAWQVAPPPHLRSTPGLINNF